MREPAPAFGGCEQIGERSIDGCRLLTVDVVPRARNDGERGRWRRALEKDTAIDARFVLVADYDEQRHRKSLEVRFHVPQRRALDMQHRHAQRVTLRRMLA